MFRVIITWNLIQGIYIFFLKRLKRERKLIGIFSDLGMYDRVIVQDVIKGIAQTQQVDADARHQFKGMHMQLIYIYI